MKVLIAEDNVVNQVLMRMYMKKLGWKYELVENGLFALAACKKGDFDVILMDINMPELNGIEASRYIRMFNTQIPIIALTAHCDDFDKSICANAGMNAIIEKPASLNSIREIIAELVSSDELLLIEI